jgi:hypothetical protein
VEYGLPVQERRFGHWIALLAPRPKPKRILRAKFSEIEAGGAARAPEAQRLGTRFRLNAGAPSG